MTMDVYDDILKKSLHFSTFLGYATHTISIFGDSIKIKKVEIIHFARAIQFMNIYQIKKKDIRLIHIYNSKRNGYVLLLVWLAVVLSTIDLFILFSSLFYAWEENNVKNIFGIIFGILVLFFIPFLYRAYFLLSDDSFRNACQLEIWTIHPKKKFSVILSSTDAKNMMEALGKYQKNIF